jgi:acetyl-CoA C-acetyltransferase
MKDTVIVSGVRTPIGSFGGALSSFSLGDICTSVTTEALSRAAVPHADVGHVVFGNVIQTDPMDMYLARVASVNAGVPHSVPALTLNRLCGSGLQAVITASSYISSGEVKCCIAGGGELMSQAPYWLKSNRWGQRMGDSTAVDAMVGALTDPFDKCHMGVTAENIAKKWKINREEQDNYALESHRRAIAAQDAGFFEHEILALKNESRRSETIINEDEGPRRTVDYAKLASMPPVFNRKNGVVTAGNSSTINDGAAALVLMDREHADKRGCDYFARIVDSELVGVDPKYMGIGPVPAINNIILRNNISVEDIDLWEINEAFASQVIAVIREIGINPEKINPNGGGISLGHPIGATGAILLVKSIYELRRTSGRYALISMCIGGGQGIAMLIERC